MGYHFPMEGIRKGYHLSMEGIRKSKGYLFCQKWYVKGDPVLNFFSPPPPGLTDQLFTFCFPALLFRNFQLRGRRSLFCGAS